MKVLIDADACPVRKIVEDICERRSIELLIFCDTSHVMTSNYGKVIIVSKGFDSVDFEILKNIKEEDIVITQDYGLASLVLTKCIAINQNGLIYNNDNIDSLLNSRAISAKLRRSSKVHLKGPKKRTKEDDIKFIENFVKLLD